MYHCPSCEASEIRVALLGIIMPPIIHIISNIYLFILYVLVNFNEAITFSGTSFMMQNVVPAACGEVPDRNGSPEEDIDVNNNYIDPSAEDRELKGQLLRKYSGYLGSLRQEFLKKRKKGKLPKEARQQLLDWWSRHYKWPYPSVCYIYVPSLLFIRSFLTCFKQLSTHFLLLIRHHKVVFNLVVNGCS